jgi:hypothetical protein
VSDAACHYPSARPPHIEECRFIFPPHLVLAAEDIHALSAILRVPPNEFQSGLVCRQWRRANINAEHRPKPEVLANTLMHHVLVDAAPAYIDRMRAEREILILEHGPNANHF